MAIGLPTSNFLMSVSSIGIAGNWIVEADFRSKWIRLKGYKFSPLIFSLLFFVPLIWAISPLDVSFAQEQVIGSLPLLSFPIIMASTPFLSKREWSVIMFSFLLGLSIAVVSGYVVFINKGIGSLDFEGRKMAVFISHIRLALLVVMGLFFLFQYYQKTTQLFLKIVVGLVALAFINFIRLMESGTGFVALGILLLFIGISAWKRLNDQRVKIGALIAFSLTSIGVVSYIAHLYHHQTEVRDPNNLNHLDTHTQYGNPYTHDTEKQWLENGNYIWIYISFEELEKAWNERSALVFSGTDLKGQPLYATLLRYLTSKGLRKDYNGVYQLSTAEITAIEKGITSCVPQNKGFTGRLEQIIFELINFNLNHNPNGHSVIQRLHYFSAGLHIFKSNSWLGVGTGNASRHYASYYNQVNSPLAPEKRLRAHNQILTFFVNYGIIGGMICLLAFLYPIVIHKEKMRLEHYVFLGLALTSFFVDDTLDTQAGVGFIAFFMSILFYGNVGADKELLE
jgi:hypothetical protein